MRTKANPNFIESEEKIKARTSNLNLSNQLLSTETTGLNKSKAAHQYFVNNAPIGMCSINLKGEFTFINKKLEENIEIMKSQGIDFTSPEGRMILRDIEAISQVLAKIVQETGHDQETVVGNFKNDYPEQYRSMYYKQT